MDVLKALQTLASIRTTLPSLMGVLKLKLSTEAVIPGKLECLPAAMPAAISIQYINRPPIRFPKVLVELLHTATLVHDDVVDESMERRGMFSINALWKNKIAVLVGDYLLSKGLLLSLNNKDHEVLRILSEAVRQMSEGELLQIEKSRNLNLSESVYYEIINGKTASLLSSSCAAGASTTFSNPEDVEKMRVFGQKVGMAFQIKDDLFDYSSADVGKPTGNDIKEKKLTLPLIYTLNNCPEDVKRKVIYIIKNENTDKDKVAFVIETVEKYGGIAYATSKMNEFRDDALALLHQFPESDVRAALEELVRYTTDRKY